jgi:DNA-binding NarL/FixJ family response regulator
MRVLLADDQTNVRSALRLLLEQEAGLIISDEVSDFKELMASVMTRCPELVLLDWELPGGKNEKVIAALKAKCPELIIIALSSQPEAQREALDSGADAFVSKGSSPQQVIEVLRKFQQPDGTDRINK